MKKNNYILHAEREFKALGWTGKDKMQKAICNEVIGLLNLFAKGSHSGSSAPYTINLFKQLASFKPIGPITGKDNEWCEVSDGVFQNKRCGNVFKQEGKVYDIDGKVFIDANGCSYTNYKSRVPVKFPYTPKTIYIKRQKIRRIFNWIKSKWKKKKNTH